MVRCAAERTAFRVLVLGMAILAGSTLSQARAAALYSIKSLGPAPDQVTGINDSGQMVGANYDPATGQYNPVVVTNGVVTDFRTLDKGTFSGVPVTLNGINDSGQVVGLRDTWGFTYNLNTGQEAFMNNNAVAINNSGKVASLSTWQGTHASLYDINTRQLTSLGSLGGTTTTPTALNDAGQVTGSATLVDGTQHAFLYSTGKMIDLGALSPGQSSVGTAISSDGQVVGLSGAQTFLYSNGKMTLLLPQSQMGTPVGINSLDQIIGNQPTANGLVPYLYDAKTGLLQDLVNLLPTSSSWTLSSVLRIDDQGDIFGVGNDNGQRLAFELTPQNVPEPSCLVVLALAAVAGRMLCRRKGR